MPTLDRSSYMLVQTQPGAVAGVAGYLRSAVVATDVSIVSGPYDLVVRGAATADLSEIADSLRAHPGVLRVLLCLASEQESRPHISLVSG